MKPGKRMSDRGKGGDQIFHREVAQAKKDEAALDRRRLSASYFPGGFAQRRGSGNSGGFKAFSGARRDVLRRCEPLIQFSIASKAATENISLQLREFELLVGDRVAGVERCPGERHFIVLPG